MGNTEERGTVSRREVLRLAGTAAAFCASFGFLHGGQEPASVQGKHLQVKWDKAEIKWYSGATLLHSSGVPAKVVKHLEADADAVVELRLYESGKLLRSVGTVQGKH